LQGDERIRGMKKALRQGLQERGLEIEDGGGRTGLVPERASDQNRPGDTNRTRTINR
jgi:hypothetical protein